nr:hypothetical protein [Pandoravirus massiliensis]
MPFYAWHVKPATIIVRAFVTTICRCTRHAGRPLLPLYLPHRINLKKNSVLFFWSRKRHRTPEPKERKAARLPGAISPVLFLFVCVDYAKRPGYRVWCGFFPTQPVVDI